MTLDDVSGWLDDINTRAQKLLCDTGYTWYGGFGGEVCSDPDDAQENFLRGRQEDIALLLWQLHEELSYLKKPTHGEQILCRLKDGRYGYLMEDGTPKSFFCGQPLEVKLSSRDGLPRWVCTRMEHDGDTYYLAGHRNTCLDGLTVRERW